MIDKSVREERPVMSEPQKIQPSSLADVAASKFEKQGNVSAAVGSGLDARNIYAWFGKYLAVSDMSIYFAAGTVTALIGPSGCGKSTFIRTLNRMHEFIPGAAMSGEVFLHGKDIYAAGTDVTKIRLKIGMVFQKPNPFPSMSIGENVLAGIKLAQLKVPNKNELMQECLERAGLWSEVKDRLNQPGGSLSGGQQQRLCIARSLAVNPDVLLMDEPCSALDPIATGKIEELMQNLKADYPIVIVTHNMQQAARISDYTAFFSVDADDDSSRPTGILVEYDRTGNIFSNPTDQRTLNYVSGRMG